MPHIKLPGHDIRECLCCGDMMTPGVSQCMCRDIGSWYQNPHGEVACELHMREKFSVKSLKDIHRERELAQRDDKLGFKKAKVEMKAQRYG